MIEKMADYLTLAGEELLAVRNDYLQLSQACEGIGELPKNISHNIHQAVAQKRQQFEEKVTQAHSQRQQQSWQHLFALTEKVNAYQRALSSLKPMAPKQTASALLEEINLEIAQLAYWPEGGLSAINDKIEPLSKPTANTIVINDTSRQQALTLLCIRAEILADEASPEADKQQRMEYQVNLLQQGLGKGHAATDTFAAQALAWVAVEAVDEAVYHTQFTRFQHCWQAVQQTKKALPRKLAR
jgi:hypothetical protein